LVGCKLLTIIVKFHYLNISK